MSITNTLDPVQEVEEINKIISLNQRPKPEIIESESFKKSIEIISKYDYKFTTNEHINEYKICFFCKNQFPTIQGNSYSCNNCGKTFCVKHRNVLDHHCQKINPNLEKYLAAKNIFREKIRMLKMKGH